LQSNRISAKKLLYLYRHDIVSYPNMSLRFILNRNKKVE